MLPARIPFPVLVLATAALSVPAVHAADCPQVFRSPTFYLSGNNPALVAVADFDRDGVQDLAVTNSDFFISNGAASSVRILRGIGTGGVGNGEFADGGSFAAGNKPFGIVVEDFNGDQILDLAVANWGSNNVSILLGQGSAGVWNGNFAPPVQYPAGISPYGIVSADFDQDGILDLAIADNGENTVRILRGQGAGTFILSASYNVGALSLGIVKGDFNEDGRVDLIATAGPIGKIAVLLGQAGGTFASQLVDAGTNPYEIAIGDFNEDGINDLAVANTPGGGVVRLLGQGAAGVGNGTFGAAAPFAGFVHAAGVVAQDFDQDGITDLAVTDADGRLLFLRGLGDSGLGNGLFANPVPILDPGFPVHPVSDDFNEDGRPDVVTVNHLAGSVGVLLNGCVENAPVLVRVRDVPMDQGGKVFVQWLPSPSDTRPPPPSVITSYRVWRRIPPEAVGTAVDLGATIRRYVPVAAQASLGQAAVWFWELLTTVPAQALEGYGYTAATVQDSMRDSNPYTAFMVTALAANGSFFESNVDSGYSVDNLKPGQPRSFVVHTASSGTTLHWDPIDDSDFESFQLYRGEDPGFQPDLEHHVATLSDTGYVDPQGTAASIYKLCAVDRHGNESPFATALPSRGATSVPGGEVAGLTGIAPNPSPTGRFAISFALTSHVRTTLELYDVGGRRLLSAEVGRLGPGTHVFQLAPQHTLPVGVYQVRFAQAGRVFTAKAVVLR